MGFLLKVLNVKYQSSPPFINRYTVTKHPTSKAFELLSIAMEEAMCSQPFTSSSKMEYKTVTNYEWHAIVLFPTVNRPTDRKFLAYYSNHWFCSSTIFFLQFLLPRKVDRKTWFCIYLLNRSCLKIEFEIEDFVKHSFIF